MTDILFDPREWKRALLLYEEASHKDQADVLNHAGANLAFTAASKTPVETSGEIRADFAKDDHLLAAMTSIHLRKIGAGILPKGAFKLAMKELLKSRYVSQRYLRSTWAPIVEAFGRKFRGGSSEKAKAEFVKRTGIASTARLASTRDLSALLDWSAKEPNSHLAKGAEEIAHKALKQAFPIVIADLLKYALPRLAKTAKKYSA